MSLVLAMLWRSNMARVSWSVLREHQMAAEGERGAGEQVQLLAVPHTSRRVPAGWLAFNGPMSTRQRSYAGVSVKRATLTR
jgi:hypothetical protein